MELQLAKHSNIAGLLGYCGTTIVTEYHQSFLRVMFREGQQLPIGEVLSMALDAATEGYRLDNGARYPSRVRVWA